MMALYLQRHPRILLLVLCVIVVSGGAAYFVMPHLEDPVLSRRVGIVATSYPGASPQQVESLVTIPLEQQLGSIAGIKQVRSTSQSGVSTVVIELEDRISDVEPVWSIVRSRISNAAPALPDACAAPALEVVPLKAYAAIIAIRAAQPAAQGSVAQKRQLAALGRIAKRLEAKILAISGTELVKTSGLSQEEIVVQVPPEKLASMGVSTGRIAAQVQHYLTRQTAGVVRETSGEISLQMHHPGDPVEQIKNVMVTYGARGETIRLAEVASVEKRLQSPPVSAAIIDGQPAVVLSATVNDELRIADWHARLDTILSQQQKESGEDVQIETLFAQRDHIATRMNALLTNLGVGILAVTLVVLLLMGWRSMLVVAATLPLSAMMVLAAMRLMGVPVHQMSVTGLIVALGLLIDNAIVIVEEVRSRLLSGATVTAAIGDSVRHLQMPLLVSTATTVLAFLPVATLSGPAGEFTGSIAISVILAVIASFLLAMSVLPAAVGLLKVNPSQQGVVARGISSQWLTSVYEKTLSAAFRYPLLAIFVASVAPLSGFAVATYLPVQFFPPSDRAQLQVEVELPARQSHEATLETVQQLRRRIATDKAVRRQHWFLGESAPTFYYNVVPRRRNASHYAQAIVDLHSAAHTRDITRRLQRLLDEAAPHARIVVRQLEQGPPFDAPLELRVTGPDIGELKSLGSQLRAVLAGGPAVTHTRSDLEETVPQLEVQVDPARASAAGLDPLEVSRQLYTSLEGAPAGTVFDGDQDLSVRVKAALGDKHQMKRLAALPLQAPPRGGPRVDPATGQPLTGLTGAPLHDVAEVKLSAGVGSIVRIDGRRVNEVKAYLQAGVLPSHAMADFEKRLAATDFTLPPGYSVQRGGEAEQRSQAVNSLIANGFIIFAVMVLTLVAAFGSFRCMLIIAAVGGLAVGMAPLTLACSGYAFGFMAVVGAMGLVGVAINDSIVVLAAIRADADARTGDRQAMVRVVSGCTRHILATTLTTIAGFTPLILSGGGFWPPLAVIIGGGVGGATFLALYFTPAMHLLTGSSQPQS